MSNRKINDIEIKILYITKTVLSYITMENQIQKTFVIVNYIQLYFLMKKNIYLIHIGVLENLIVHIQLIMKILK